MFEALRQGSDHLRLLPVLPAAFRHHLRACQGPDHQASQGQPRGEDSQEERISAEEIMKHSWLQDSQVIRRSKRLVEEVDVEVIHEEVMDYPFNLFEFKF